MNLEIRYWADGEWFPVDQVVLDWLHEVMSHPYVVQGQLPDIRVAA